MGYRWQAWFRNTRRVISYKFYSLHSTPIERAQYRWPKIDIFPYQQSQTHVFAFPRPHRNTGTIKYLSVTYLEPFPRRILGPLLIPNPRPVSPSI
ncbi:unnamed protein product [Adineta ricciae]|uniref:Uncharacterized protein n=1 Tax=Adineta ricciae TaxID=249248 RepID=A0A814HTQ4_ADIRI|nr:unnamed protein product [Adineta ricciae]CAF1307484.1 unnamed protein product [Adineta ricciae]